MSFVSRVSLPKHLQTQIMSWLHLRLKRITQPLHSATTATERDFYESFGEAILKGSKMTETCQAFPSTTVGSTPGAGHSMGGGSPF